MQILCLIARDSTKYLVKRFGGAEKRYGARIGSSTVNTCKAAEPPTERQGKDARSFPRFYVCVNAQVPRTLILLTWLTKLYTYTFFHPIF